MFDLWSFMAGVVVAFWEIQLWHLYVYHGARRTAHPATRAAAP